MPQNRDDIGMTLRTVPDCHHMDEHEATVLRASLRTPRAAGIAGIVFSLLLASVLLLIRFAVPSGGSNGEGWLIARDRQPSVVVALNLVPFAGIAFLWFIGVIRDNVGDREDRFFATVFLGSGLLFVAMLFVGAAIAGGLLADTSIPAGQAASSELWALQRRITFTIINVYAIRMGAVFILSTTMIGVRTRTIPRWLAVVGFVASAILLFGVTISPLLNLVMPVWAFVLSAYLLVRSRTVDEPTASTSTLPSDGQVHRRILGARLERPGLVVGDLG